MCQLHVNSQVQQEEQYSLLQYSSFGLAGSRAPTGQLNALYSDITISHILLLQ